MQRTPEPDLMDDEAQALAYAQADFREPNHALLEALLSEVPRVDGPILDLGCGPADITLELARRYPDSAVVGVDGAERMLAHGRKALVGSPLQARVELRREYLPSDALEADRYALVFSNSLLHHLVDPTTLWTTIRKVARPGASVFVQDLTRPDSEAAAQALVDEYAAGEPEVLRRDFYRSLLAAYRIDEVREQIAAAGLNLVVQAQSDRHFIAFGVA